VACLLLLLLLLSPLWVLRSHAEFLQWNSDQLAEPLVSCCCHRITGLCDGPTPEACRARLAIANIPPHAASHD
jgi:hypothetical protein